jgi:hypothetical protein
MRQFQRIRLHFFPSSIEGQKVKPIALAHFYVVHTVDVVFDISSLNGWRRIEELHTVPRQKRRMLEMDRVAGVIEVSLIDDTHEVVISYPASKPNSSGVHEIVIMPRYARHLAQVLIEYADISEAESRAKELAQKQRERSRTSSKQPSG